MNQPSPALVAQEAVRRLPRLALVLFVLTYAMAGFWGREPWKTIDMSSLGVMLELVQGKSSWLSPGFLGQAPEAPALLPYWLGAWALALAPAHWDAAWVSRIPFALMLLLTLVSTWKAIELLARSPGAQPVAFAFGGEARPDDYARVMADAGLLALVACLGLAQASHEVTPMAVQLCMTSMLFCGLSGLTTRKAPVHLVLCVAAIAGLTLSGAPTLALLMSACAVTQMTLDPELSQRKTFYCVVLSTTGLISAWLAQTLNLWQFSWRGFPEYFRDWITFARLWVWFTWPAWPLALWTLWVWRRSWWGKQPSRHIALPLIMVLPAAMASLLTYQEERALLLTLPFMAALSAFALPTLRRSVSALIDWFTLLFFSGSAMIIWIVWLAGMTGWPTQPAANVARLFPGLDLRFSGWVFGLATVATLTWLWLVSWRVGRHRSALWKSLILPASGATLCWLLLMTLWMPMIDFARGYAPLVRNVATLMGHPSCVQAIGLSQAQWAALQHHGHIQVDLQGDMSCDWLVVGMRSNDAFQVSEQASGWRHVQHVRRPTDQYENLVLYKRQTDKQP